MSIETTTSVEITPGTIDVSLENAGDLVVANAHEVRVSTPEDIIEVAKKEYAIVGDALFASVSAESAPYWLTELIDNLVDVSITTGLSDYNQLRADVLAAIDSIDVAQNTYVQQINFDADVDSAISTRLTTFNSTLGTTYATKVELTNLVSSETDAIAIDISDLQAFLTADINARVNIINLAIAAETSARADSIATLTSVYQDQASDIQGASTAVSGLQTYVGLDVNSNPDGTGLLNTVTSHSLAFTNLESSTTGPQGEVAFALSNLKQENIVYTDELGTDIRNTFAYDSTIIINGEYYKTGFGIDSTATGGVSEETAFSSEFWVNAEKFVLKSPTYPGIEANFQVTPTGIVLALEHTEATRNDPKGVYNAGTEYNLGDLVSYLGSSYVALGTHTGITPVEGANWQLLSAIGATGATGAAGNDGSAGVDSKAVKLTSAIQVVEYDSANARVTPDSIILFTATPQNVSVPTYRFFVDDVPTGPASADATYDYATSATYVSTPVKIEVEIYDDAVLVGRDQTSVYAIKPGSNVVTVILSNEAHTIPTDSAGDNGVYTGSGTTIKVYEGATELIYETGAGFPTTGGKFRVATTPSNITGGAISGNGTTTATVAAASNMTQNTAAITYTINTRNSVDQNLAIDKIQSFSKSVAGINGAAGEDGSAGVDSKSVKLTAAAQVVEYDASDARVTPSIILFTATPQNASVPTYRFFVDDSPIGPASDTATYDYYTSATYVSTPVKVEVELYDSAVLVARDQVSIYAIKPGANVVTALLGNEAHTIPTDSAGNNGVYTGSGTTIKVYEGAAELTYEAGSGFPSTNSKFRIETTPANITNGSISGAGTTTATVGDASSMTQDVAAITYTINTRNSVAQNVAITRIQSFSKSTAGVDGSTGATGDTGATGARGTATLTYAVDLPATAPAGVSSAAVAGYWDVAASTAYEVEIAGDVLVLTNTNVTDGWTHIFEYDGASWVAHNTFTVNGNQVVNGTLAAAALVGGSLTSLTTATVGGPKFEIDINGIALFRGIEIRDDNDNVIMASGASMDYSVLSSLPTSLADISGSESTKLTNISENADVTAAVTSGNGSNVCNARYSTFQESTLPPTSTSNGTSSLETGLGYFGTNSLRVSASASDCYVYLGASSSDYNIPIEGGKSYIISAYVRSASASVGVEFYLSQDAGGHIFGSATGGPSNTWTRVSCVVTTDASAKMAVLRLDNEGGTGVDVLFDGIMIEPKVGNLTVPGPYVPPNSYNNIASTFVDQGAFATLSQITGGNISTYIASAAIDTAYIANAAIKTALIDDLQVSTLKIANQAVIIPTFAVQGADVTNSSTTPSVLVTETFTPTGAPIAIDFSFTHYPQSLPIGDWIVQIFLGESVLKTIGTVGIDYNHHACRGIVSGTYQYTFTADVEVTVSLRVYRSSGSGSATFASGSMKLTEMKK